MRSSVFRLHVAFGSTTERAPHPICYFLLEVKRPDSLGFGLVALAQREGLACFLLNILQSPDCVRAMPPEKRGGVPSGICSHQDCVPPGLGSHLKGTCRSKATGIHTPSVPIQDGYADPYNEDLQVVAAWFANHRSLGISRNHDLDDGVVLEQSRRSLA